MTEEQASRREVEAAREKAWQPDGFLRELFLGSFQLGLVYPYPLAGPMRPKFSEFFHALETFLREHVDPVAIDATGEYPEEVLVGLARLGAFGMTIPEE